ncbi:hypothetical protein AGABI1DRAFT_132260 [Agaricus bisporus var. burnettii JB137-S8]|uniref:Uncharacterized protein n=1 Tax=Agaricus bisporus var. burnettii (strain JB137-S8 / ATCC MYA-4627 / FGSC 10392) TaxID=597362 RepID=K5WJI9_AGABU|nr:uncharacterized protein AGABI1DRAFT_132260 [Agaricus bisporus var. burnettii JB137-S8]EKM75471.1 hypothetical protein AGABI1DRAFT_132260 [Agaricus bisporus var. burnettii JB137-S8]
MSKNSALRLPVEILEEIFSRTTGCIRLHIPKPHSACSYTPWDLALVCNYWRDIVFSTPCLWSNIFLQIIPNRQIRHKYFALLSAWNLCLDRSSSHPLTIRFIAGTGDREPKSPVSLFLEPLMEHVQRWEAVTFRAPLDTLLPYLCHYSAHYTCLRRLSIDNGYDRPKENPVGLFQNAPLLSCVSLIYLPQYGQRLGGVGIPWYQISQLKINAYLGTIDDLMDILKNTPNLVALDYAITYNYLGNGELPPLELPHLQKIVWTSYYHDGGDGNAPATFAFFRLLKALQLSVLEVNGACGDRELEAIRGCLQRSRCSVKSLTLPTPCLSSLLNLTPDVETLVFGNAPTSDVNNSTSYNSFGDDALSQVELKCLQKVVLRNDSNEADNADDPEATSQLFGLLKAPQLSVLEVTGECGDIELEAIRGFLQRSKCSLKSLKVSNPRLSSFLSVTPDVESLILPSCDKEVLMSLLQKLTLDHSASSWLCPKLKKIVLDFDIAVGPLFNAFLAMLKSRLAVPHTPLVRLQCSRLKELEFGNEVPKHMKSWVQKRLTSQESLVITYARRVSFRFHSIS